LRPNLFALKMKQKVTIYIERLMILL